jgi:hypothetical protein
MSLQLSWFEKMTPQFMFITTTSSLVWAQDLSLNSIFNLYSQWSLSLFLCMYVEAQSSPPHLHQDHHLLHFFIKKALYHMGVETPWKMSMLCSWL